jgi:hypothetical protein
VEIFGELITLKHEALKQKITRIMTDMKKCNIQNSPSTGVSGTQFTTLKNA